MLIDRALASAGSGKIIRTAISGWLLRISQAQEACVLLEGETTVSQKHPAAVEFTDFHPPSFSSMCHRVVRNANAMIAAIIGSRSSKLT